MIKFLDLQAQYASIKPEIDEAIQSVLNESSFIGGPHVATFEAAFAEFQGAEHCVGVGNGTDAIEIALEALGLPAGSEVIVQANSFIASSEAITRAGHRVVFADVDPDTYLLDLEDVAARITSKTAAIVVVHLYGRPANMAEVKALASAHNLRIIEDSAQAHGAEHQGQRVGAIGDIGTFSFYPGKNLGAYGDGGAIVTNDADLARRCRMIANHGRTDKYLHEFEGRNSRLDGLQAAILTVKLPHLDRWIDRRNDIASTYRTELADIDGLTLPNDVPEGDRHAYHLFVLRTSRRDELVEHLSNLGIPTGKHYPVALTAQPAYSQNESARSDFVANAHGAQLVSLPIGEHLTVDQAHEVAAHVRAFFTDATA
ncbi:DegT/DnrJ/EryC1/StrS family aminotransferase [Microbacterium sp. ARD31]|uniref:DegT/DnrJ/EryC1/StrS family aminotransferase n=1 Tax=Microbacterium sp. ARD31 TaxID=2962576 RepID=UPI002880FC3E|nr:DegT/DnrJ/EryC1/StrS family aminotransferase [Microbacterium sp. ARD31]MDT0183369.1 DegT/DnrJ/EryC1/StrS family aminotransferase [Microbacterium sp. ARD31]